MEFTFTTATTARASVVGYRGVNPTNPVHDKVGYALYGNGNTNGFGSGNTTLNAGREVSLMATATTVRATYSTTFQTNGVVERVNSGEQPHGLNVIIHDAAISPRVFLGPAVRHFQSPSGSSDSFQYTFATLVLAP